MLIYKLGKGKLCGCVEIGRGRQGFGVVYFAVSNLIYGESLDRFYRLKTMSRLKSFEVIYRKTNLYSPYKKLNTPTNWQKFYMN